MHQIKKGVFSLFFLFIVVIFISNSSGVPQGVTGSPAEAEHNSCGTCHNSPGNYVPSINLQILNQNQNVVTSYKPGENYILKVQVNATNNPKSFGFQLSTLDMATNTDQGSWTQFGEKVKQLNLVIQQKQRKYLVQSSPKSDGLFTATWKSPNTDKGPINFYFAGLAVNLNGSESGDTHVTGKFTLQSQNTSPIEDILAENKIKLFPNPARDIVNINSEDIRTIKISDVTGRSISQNSIVNSKVNISHLSPGMYFFTLEDTYGKFQSIHTIIKQ